jgi:Mn2+/Fe2+ NRAMP family transporter
MTVTKVAFGPSADRRHAGDRAHRGDVEGALGVISVTDTGPRHGLARRLTALAAVLGPGLVVMAADNDAGGISTYAQAGQDYGVRIVWLVVLLMPVLFINQEMAARLGAVTGAGHAQLITARFGKRWGGFALADLLALNLLTLVTEFVGVSMSLEYFGVSKYVSVPAAAVFLIAVTAPGSFRGWERAMYALIAASLAVVPLACLGWVHRDLASSVPSGGHGPGGGGLFLVVALVGTTVAPWQLFFQQSNVVDKRITSRFLGYERADTAIGTVLFGIGALGVLLACGFVLGRGGGFADGLAVAHGLRAAAGGVAGALFAVVLGTGSVLGASAVTLATSYAVGDYFGLRHSLHRRWREARTFHRTYALSVLVAAAVVLLPQVPLGLLTTAVQALAGVLLPSATVFLLLLCNDRAVLGPHVNPRWLNVIAAAVIGALLALSALLTATTIAPRLPVLAVAVAMAVVAGLLAAAAGGVAIRTRSAPAVRGTTDSPAWTMPPIESLPPPDRSPWRTLSLVVLRCYLFTAIAVLAIRVIQLAFGRLPILADWPVHQHGPGCSGHARQGPRS